MNEEKTIPSAYKSVEGYLINGLFYYDKNCDREIDKKSMTIYIDIPSKEKYQWSWQKNSYIVLKYAKDLLPIGTRSTIPMSYRQINTYGSVRSSLVYEHNRMLYIGSSVGNIEDGYNGTETFRIQRLNIMTNKLEFLVDIPNTSIGNYYLRAMCVDDNYIYLKPYPQKTSAYPLFRIDLKTFVIDSFQLPKTFVGVKIEEFDENTIVMVYNKGLMFFNKNRQTWSTKEFAIIGDGNIVDFSIGNKLVEITFFTRSTQTFSFLYWDKNTDEQKIVFTHWHTIDSPAQPWFKTCYGDNHFYIVASSYLFICEENMENINLKPFSIPWTYPMFVNYSKNVVYNIQSNKNSICLYDIKKNMYRSVILPWTLPEQSNTMNIQSTTFEGYLFLPYITMGILNYDGSSKYNLGYKFDQYMFPANLYEKDKYTSVDECVKFEETYVTIEDGVITKPVEITDEVNNIKSVNMNKSSYTKIKNISFLSKSDEEEIIEGE